jgi:uncharacterized protein YbjT (DUF2867 family)
MQQEIQRRESVPGLMNSQPIAAPGATRPPERGEAPDWRRACNKANPTVLVTGAGGFVGRHLVPYLAARGYKVIAASRTAANFDNPNVSGVSLPDISKLFDWRPFLEQCDAVVHLAGIAHKHAGDDFYDRVNHRATSALARAISRSGNKHLVFISSIAAQSGSYSDHELTEDDFPTPNNAYGRSKFAAEQAIRAADISFAILRPVVIYGEGEKGNFAVVHRLSRLPIPLPFGALHAQRSVLSIQNFNSAVETAHGEKPSSFRTRYPSRSQTSSRVTASASADRPGWYEYPKAGSRRPSRPWAGARSGSESAAPWWRLPKNCLRSAGSRPERAASVGRYGELARSPPLPYLTTRK